MGLFRAKARRTDPETSHEAAQSVTDTTATQSNILRLFKKYKKLTDVQLETLYYETYQVYQTPQSLRSRRAELVKRGRIEFADEYGTSPTGRRARVWKVVK